MRAAPRPLSTRCASVLQTARSLPSSRTRNLGSTGHCTTTYGRCQQHHMIPVPETYFDWARKSWLMHRRDFDPASITFEVHATNSDLTYSGCATNVSVAANDIGPIIVSTYVAYRMMHRRRTLTLFCNIWPVLWLIVDMTWKHRFSSSEWVVLGSNSIIFFKVVRQSPKFIVC